MTNSGSSGVLCADSCATDGLTALQLSQQTQSILASFLLPTAALRNPVDVIGFATEEKHAQAVGTLLNAGAINALMIVHVSVGQSGGQ